MRIGMITSAPFPPREGIGFYVWNLSRYLTQLGHEVQIITRGGMERTIRSTVERVTLWRPPFFPIYPFHVHLHHLFVNRIIRRLEADIDLFHVHSPLAPPIASRQPVMLTMHSSIGEDLRETTVKDFYSLLMKLQMPFSRQLELELIRKANRINTVSPHVANVLHRYPLGQRHIEVMWNGVDLDFFTPMQEPEERQPTVLTVGRLAPGKGLEDFLKATITVAKRYPRTRFLIVGDGPLRTLMQRRIAQAGLDQIITLTGHVSDRQRLLELYRQASVFVLPSHHEGLPTVLLEAMACALPVVSTAVGGVPYVVSDKENGLLVQAKQPDGLAEAICSLLGDGDLRRNLGKRARQKVEDQFSWPVIAPSFAADYEVLLGNGRPA